MSPIRIAVLNSHPIQYFAPMYAYLNTERDLEITALYCSDFSLRGGQDPGFKRAVVWDIDLLAGYQSVFLGEAAKKRVPAGFFSLIAPQVWSEIRSGKYDVLWLHGHNYAANLIAWLAAMSKGVPVMMRGETHLGLERSGLKRWLRKLLIGNFYKTIDRFLAIGTVNTIFYEAMGVPKEKIFLVPYTVDNQRFMAAAKIDKELRSQLLTKFQLSSDRPIILFASKFIDRKHPCDLLRAASILRQQGLDFQLLMVGTGELESELRQLKTDLALDNVVFGGFVNQSELPQVYAISDIFALPSDDEPWGLIVNEVMCASLPVVITDEVGCVPDLVKDGMNGYLHKPGDLVGLAEALARLLHDENLRDQMGKSSLERIQQWSYTQCLQGVRSAVKNLPVHCGHQT